MREGVLYRGTSASGLLQVIGLIGAALIYSVLVGPNDGDLSLTLSFSTPTSRHLWLGSRVISSRFYRSLSATAQLSYVLHYPPITVTPAPMTKSPGEASAARSVVQCILRAVTQQRSWTNRPHSSRKK